MSREGSWFVLKVGRLSATGVWPPRRSADAVRHPSVPEAVTTGRREALRPRGDVFGPLDPGEDALSSGASLRRCPAFSGTEGRTERQTRSVCARGGELVGPTTLRGGEHMTERAMPDLTL